jgi:hypothetical protein
MNFANTSEWGRAGDGVIMEVVLTKYNSHGMVNTLMAHGVGSCSVHMFVRPQEKYENSTQVYDLRPPQPSKAFCEITNSNSYAVVTKVKADHIKDANFTTAYNGTYTSYGYPTVPAFYPDGKLELCCIYYIIMS